MITFRDFYFPIVHPGCRVSVCRNRQRRILLARWFVLMLVVSFFSSCGKKTESTLPVTGNITESVYASGKVLATDQYLVYPVVSGILVRSLRNPGDAVAAGDTLFMVDNLTSDLTSENARALLELNKELGRAGSSKFEELELAQNIAREKYVFDSTQYERQKRLWQKNIGSGVELEQKELAFQSSKQQWNAATARLDQLKLQLANEIKRSEINYAITTKSKSDFVITSKIDGVVFDVYREQNELVSPQSALAVVGNPAKFYLELQVDEYDIVKITTGQKVLVTMDIYRGEVFEGVVRSVSPIMDERSRSFTVEADFVEPPVKIYPNVTAEANIVLQRKESVLMIPRRFLVDDRYVYVSEDERAEVVTGLKNYDQVEIVSGIESTREISRYSPPA
jgi:multidrug efflux pump subunit AcrA (membrane-fusion protein)